MSDPPRELLDRLTQLNLMDRLHCSYAELMAMPAQAVHEFLTIMSFEK